MDNLDVDGRRALLRADLDVALRYGDDGAPEAVADDAPIRAALTSIEELRRRGARLVLISVLGGAQGARPALSMRPVADRLAALSGSDVPLAPAVVGPEVRKLTERLPPGEMLMLENAASDPGEARNDPVLAFGLAHLAEVYIDDAFAAVHRATASNEGVAHLLPCAAGRLVERELGALRAITDQPDRPLIAILGGARLQDKIGVLRRLLELADVLCLGGGLCLPFLAAQGRSVGGSPCPREDVELARQVLDDARASSCRLALAEDLRLLDGDAVQTRMAARVLAGVDVPAGSTALDIGPATADRFAAEIAAAATVFWNGPMGRLELEPFAAGTRAVAGALANARATTVLAGTHTVRAVHSYGLKGRFTHVSTGGRATLAFLEGRELPGLAVLTRGAAGEIDGFSSSGTARTPRIG